MTELSLASMWEGLGWFSRADFLVTPDYRMTQGDLRHLIGGMLEAFDAYDLAAGCRVLILTHNDGAAITAFAAALLDGLIPVMLTPDTPEARVASLATSVAPGLIVADAGRHDEDWMGERPRIAVEDRSAERSRRSMGFGQRPQPEASCGMDLPKGKRGPRLPASNNELVYLLFTSGTTQVPNGVMVTRRNVLANLSTLSRLFGYSPNSRIFNDMVLAHGDGLVQGPLLALANHCALIRSGGFTIQKMESWLDRVRQERATHVITVPTVWSMIDRYAKHDDYFDAPECTHLMSVAARLDPGLWQRLETRFKRPVFNQYGLTETVASALYAGPHPEMGAFGTIGRPVDCEARIASPASTSDGPGELQLRGDNIFEGYWKNSQRTAESFTPDGWMRTGDLAARRDDGSYDILGRLKTVIMCGGFLIRPEEIDEVMAAHPAVAESVTVGLPDSTFGEIPVTAVVLDSPIDEVAMTAYARTKLEALKVPKRVISLPSIPRGDAGKPKLDDVRAALVRAVGSEAIQRAGCAIDDIFPRICSLAADVFRVDPASLRSTSTPDTVAGWDSFSQIALILDVEKHFGIQISVAQAAGVRNLGELAAVVENARK